MGTSSSHREAEAEERNQDVRESDIVQLVQYLIRSGQVHILESDGEEDSSDGESFGFVPVKNKCMRSKMLANPNTEVLNGSEFKFFTEKASGLIQKTGEKRPKTLAGLIASRERGLPGSLALTTGDKCRIMNTFLPNKRNVINSLSSKIFCGSFSNEGKIFLTASQDKKIRLFDSTTDRYQFIKSFDGHGVGWSILDTAFSPDGECVVYSSWSESLQLFRINGDPDSQDTLLINPVARRFCVFSLKFSCDGNEILCGANDGCLYIYDRFRGKSALRITCHEDDVNAVAFADDTSQILYSGGDDGVVKVWDRRALSESDPVPVGDLGGHMDGITYIEPRGDGRHLLSNSKDQTIKLWDVRKFSSSEAVTNTKKAVACQNWDYRWQGIPRQLKNPRKRLEGDTSVMTYFGHTVLHTLVRCHFSPLQSTGQRYIYAGCATGRVIIYDALTGRIDRELDGHKMCVRDAAWHPYRPEIITTSWDGTIARWCYSEPLYNEKKSRASCFMDSPDNVPVRRSQRLREKLDRENNQALAEKKFE